MNSVKIAIYEERKSILLLGCLSIMIILTGLGCSWDTKVDKNGLDKVLKTPKPQVVLVVEYLDRKGLRYGAVEGAKYLFKVKEVLRLTRDPDETKNYDYYPEMVKHAKDLASHNRMEWRLDNIECIRKEYERALAETDKKLKNGKTYILAINSSRDLLHSELGDGSFAGLLGIDTLVLDYDKQTLDKIDEIFAKRFKKSTPIELKPPTTENIEIEAPPPK